MREDFISRLNGVMAARGLPPAWTLLGGDGV